MSNVAKLSDFVSIDSGFKPAVQLPYHFEDEEQNAQLIKAFIPTTDTIKFFTEIAQSLVITSNERARMLTGTFGTGKSDLLLMLCNYLSRSTDDAVMKPFYDKLLRIDKTRSQIIIEQRKKIKPFLVVLLQANMQERFPGFVLYGLQEALKKVGLDHLMAPTRYKAAIEQIQNWQEQKHQIFDVFSKILEENEQTTITSLVSELDSPLADTAFLKFKRTFYAAVGTEFHIHGYKDPASVYQQVAEQLRKTDRFSGILIVCDEFTEMMRRLNQMTQQQSGDLEAEALNIQDLATRSNSSGQYQLHFIVSSLDSFSSASKESTTTSSSQILEKIGGRFKSFALDIQDNVELMKGAFQYHQDIPLSNLQTEQLITSSQPCWPNQPRSWLNEWVIKGCFPLHPQVTYALPLINRRVAQNNRTMFLFLQDPDGLQGFIEQSSLYTNYPEWVNLLTLDVLFDYFKDSIQGRHPEIIEAYNHSTQVLRSAQLDNPLGQRVLKIITLCELVEPFLIPTHNFIRSALNLPITADDAVEQTLETLVQIEALNPPTIEYADKNQGSYSLPMSGRVNTTILKSRVLKRAQEIDTSIDQLRKEIPLLPIEAEEYNRNRGSHRYLEAKVIDMYELRNSHLLRRHINNYNGALWYVIATTEDECAEAKMLARDITKEYKRIVIATPKDKLNILENFKRYQALQLVRDDPSLDTNSRQYLQNNGRIGKDFYNQFQNDKLILQQAQVWNWFNEGLLLKSIATLQAVQSLASTVMEIVFTKTPELKLRQHFTTNDKRRTTNYNNTIKSILQNELRFSKTNNKEGSVIRDGFMSLGLVKLQDRDGAYDIYSLCEPKQGYSKEIWDIITKHLQSGKEWHRLISHLKHEPYGLYDSVIEAFIACFLTYYADSIEILNKFNKPVALEEKTLKELLDKDNHFQVKYVPLSQEEREWLQGIAQKISNKPFDSRSIHGKTLRQRVGEEVSGELSRLKLPKFVDQLSIDKLKSYMPEQEDEYIKVIHLLLLQQKQKPENIAHVLLNDIPNIINQYHSADKILTIADKLEYWNGYFSVLKTVPKAIKSNIVQQVIDIFGGEVNSSNNSWTAIYNWRQTRSNVESVTSKLKTSARQLFLLTKELNGSVEETLLEQYARQVPQINTEYHNWSSIEHINIFLETIKNAYNEIELLWKSRASADDIWHEGLSAHLQQTPVTGVKKQQVAKFFYEWYQHKSWPAFITSLQAQDLKVLWSSLSEQEYKDILVIIRSSHFSEGQWQSELSGNFAQKFGISTWSREEVSAALARIGIALQYAQEIETLAQRYIVSSFYKLFPISRSRGGSTEQDPITTWLEQHQIPIENELPDSSRVLLTQLSTTDLTQKEVILNGLPKIFGIPYKDWASFDEINYKLSLIAEDIECIERYKPLQAEEIQWLNGIRYSVAPSIQGHNPLEKTRFTSEVAKKLQDWVFNQQLAPFILNLTVKDLEAIDTESSSVIKSTSILLLNSTGQLDSRSEQFIFEELPRSLKPSGFNLQNDVTELIDLFNQTIKLIQQIDGLFKSYLFEKITSIFDIDRTFDSSISLMNALQKWKRNLGLLSDETHSKAAEEFLRLIQGNVDDAERILLASLPQKLLMKTTSYRTWKHWNEHVEYLEILQKIAQELTEKSQISGVTDRVQNLWEDFLSKYEELTLDEKRWLNKALNQEFLG
jgi:hypothetical protein